MGLINYIKQHENEFPDKNTMLDHNEFLGFCNKIWRWDMKVWRPRFHDGQVSIRRKGKWFAVVCKSKVEAELVEDAIVRVLSKSRKKQ